MRIQYLSDVHLDVNYFFDDTFHLAPADDVDVLVLAGDIGDPRDAAYGHFLAQASQKFKHVILVAGNHEYYGDALDTTDARLSRLAARFTNVHFLNQRAVTIDGVRFLGCTLWSDVTDAAARDVNDYRRIKGATPAGTRALHAAHVAWIEGELAVAVPTVVVTHHAPDGRMNAPFADGKLDTAFATDLPHLFRPPVLAWICGHVHKSATHVTHGIPCSTNCYGYDGEDTGFDPLEYMDVTHLRALPAPPPAPEPASCP